MRDSLRSPRQIKLRKLLRDIRDKRGLTQAGVAARLGKPQSFVAKYEVRALDLEPSAAMRQLLKALDGDAS